MRRAMTFGRNGRNGCACREAGPVDLAIRPLRLVVEKRSELGDPLLLQFDTSTLR